MTWAQRALTCVVGLSRSQLRASSSCAVGFALRRGRWKSPQSSPVKPDQPIRSVKRAWTRTLQNAKLTHFPIYNLRHVFCTRLSWVAADAVVQRAMRHMSPETKRHYQLGMTEQVRQSLEQVNRRVYGGGKVLHFYDSRPPDGGESQKGVRN